MNKHIQENKKKGFNFFLKEVPGPASIITIIFILFTLFCCVLGFGRILNLAFPLAAFLIGIVFYHKYPNFYIGFNWWLWFLAPFVRRIADYKSGYTDPSPIILAPYLFSSITVITLLQELPQAKQNKSIPFVLSLCGLMYGFTIGLFNYSPSSVCIDLLKWLAPVLFGFHLFTNWRKYPKYKQTFEFTFLWGVIILGIYGIFQYLIAPDWDIFWMTNTEMASIGNPEPLSIRVWSTMNSPGSFASVMAAGLLFLFVSKSKLRFLAMSLGYLAFLLSLARSAWLSWLVALFIMSFYLKGKQKIYLIVTILFVVLCIFISLNIEPFSDRIAERFTTFSNIEQDHSASVRQQTYKNLLGEALFSIIGLGLGTSKYDSAILSMFFSLGWLGTSLYVAGIFMLILKLFNTLKNSLEPFACTTTAIAIAYCTKIILGVAMIEVSGMILWSCIAMSLSARKFYLYQKKSGLCLLKL